MTTEGKKIAEEFAKNFKTVSLIKNSDGIAEQCDSECFKYPFGEDIMKVVIELGKEALAGELFAIGMARLAEKVMEEE